MGVAKREIVNEPRVAAQDRMFYDLGKESSYEETNNGAIVVVDSRLALNSI